MIGTPDRGQQIEGISNSLQKKMILPNHDYSRFGFGKLTRNQCVEISDCNERYELLNILRDINTLKIFQNSSLVKKPLDHWSISRDGF